MVVVRDGASGWRSSLCVAVSIMMVTAATPGWAQPRGDRARDAQVACLAGRYQQGVELLAQLYVETGDPNYIYNQGRCYQQNARFDEALGRFHEYRRKATPLPAADLADLNAKIAECERMRALQTGGVAQRADQPRADLVQPGLSEAERARLNAESARLRKAGVVLWVIAAASLAVGVASSIAVEAVERKNNGIREADDDGTGQRLELIQWFAYGAAAVTGVGGTALYFLGAPDAGTDLGAAHQGPRLTSRVGAGLSFNFGVRF